MKNKNESAAINYLQCELKEILSTFINGGFSASSYIFYPIIKNVSSSLVKRLMDLFSFVKNKSQNYGLNFSNSLEKFNQFSNLSNAKNFAVILSALYEDFDKNKKMDDIKKINVKSNILNENDYHDKYLSPVLELKKFSQKKLYEYVVDVHVHGSLATLDYIKGWSDFDTLVILKKDTITDYTRILKLRNFMYISRKYLYKMDPLQHHGHLIFTEYDFDYYCQTFFPIVLFKYSKSLLNCKSFKFKLRDCHSENIKKFNWFVDYFKNIGKNEKYHMNSYDLKFFLHAITLFPTMYLQAKGLHVYKKFSFDIAKRDFSKKEWDVIDYASSLRKSWKSPKNLSLIIPYAKVNPLLAYQINSKYWDIMHNIIKLNKMDMEKIVGGMKILVDSASNKIQK